MKSESARLLKPFSLDEYQQLVSTSEVLEQDGHGLKVLKTPEGLIVKIFRRKKLVSSALIKSYATRFVENARKLNSLGFNTVEIVDLYYCKPIKRVLVFYHPLPGETLRTLLHHKGHDDGVMELFIDLLAQMHEKGVFFRSCHFNNIIVANSMDRMGLIDISDMKIQPQRLSYYQRKRNFKHMVRYKVDQESIRQFGINRFMERYFRSCSLPESRKDQLRNSLNQLIVADGGI